MSDDKAPLPHGIPFAQIVDTANDVIIITTPDLEPPGPTIVYVNPAFLRLTGYDASDVIGLSPRILQGPGTSRVTLDAVRAALLAGRPVKEKVLNYAKGGAPYWLDLRIEPLRDPSGTITHFAAIQRDVTLDKMRVDELEYLANRDTLTGIPNRRAFLRGVERAIEQRLLRGTEAAARPTGPCLAFIDVDRFKTVNDSFGHAVGDAVLYGIADRLAGIVRRSDILGRLGGEEFAVCMPFVSHEEAQALAERLRRSVASEPFETSAGPVSITVSIGVAAFRTGEGLALLLEHADAAMYLAKRRGRNRVAGHCETSN